MHPQVLQNLKNSRDPTEILGTVQREILQNTLQSCDKVALVDPEHMCVYHYRKLKKAITYQEVYIVKEVFSEFGWFFSLTGIVPPYVTKNIQNLRALGIWEWSVKMTNYFSSQDMDELVIPTAANMQRNVAVIFTVWILGLVSKSLWYIVEMMHVISRAFVRYVIFSPNYLLYSR